MSNSWEEYVAEAKANGGKQHTPNGVPIKCINHDVRVLLRYVVSPRWKDRRRKSLEEESMEAFSSIMRCHQKVSVGQRESGKDQSFQELVSIATPGFDIEVYAEVILQKKGG